MHDENGSPKERARAALREMRRLLEENDSRMAASRHHLDQSDASVTSAEDRLADLPAGDSLRQEVAVERLKLDLDEIDQEKGHDDSAVSWFNYKKELDSFKRVFGEEP